MDPEQNTPQIQNSEPHPEAPEQLPPPPGFWRRYRWVMAGALVVVAAGVAVALFVWHTQPDPAKSSTATTYPQTKGKPATTTQPANTWKATVDPKALPLGDGKVSASPQAGYITSCTTSFRGGGARHAGSWINESAGTWDSDAKVAVTGSVDWPSASYSDTTMGTNRTLTTDEMVADDTALPVARRGLLCWFILFL